MHAHSPSELISFTNPMVQIRGQSALFWPRGSG
jgi:hypothetical protein